MDEHGTGEELCQPTVRGPVKASEIAENVRTVKSRLEVAVSLARE